MVYNPRDRRFGAGIRSGSTSSYSGSTSIANYGNSAMTRGNFMRGLGVAGAGIAAGVMGLSGTVRATGSKNLYVIRVSADTIKVYPMDPNNVPTLNPNALYSQGQPFSDAKNVQLAVDSANPGGTAIGNVILSATDFNGTPKPFNFGDASLGQGDCVEIKQGVTITGENGAMIIGGGKANNGYFTAPLIVNSVSKVTISNLTFDSFGCAAVCVRKCNGVVITNNVMTNVVPEYQPIYYNVPFAYGVLVTGLIANPALHLNYGTIQGNIVITGNTIDLWGQSNDFDDYWLFGAGIGVADIYNTTAPAPSITIQNNNISNPGQWGIWTPGTLNSRITIDRNTINQRAGTYAHDWVWGGGIAVYPHFASPAGVPTITNNTLTKIQSTLESDLPPPTGIYLEGVQGITANLGSNVITGSGDYAIMVEGPSNSNIFNIYPNTLYGFTCAMYLDSMTYGNTVNLNGSGYYVHDDDNNTVNQ